VLIMLDSPHGTPETHGLNEGAWNAAPTVGKVIERIAPILGVARTPAALVQAPKPPPTAEQLNGGEQ
jgi:cell division protein FtsI (penicillin-binding protein 3)